MNNILLSYFYRSEVDNADVLIISGNTVVENAKDLAKRVNSVTYYTTDHQIVKISIGDIPKVNVRPIWYSEEKNYTAEIDGDDVVDIVGRLYKDRIANVIILKTPITFEESNFDKIKGMRDIKIVKFNMYAYHHDRVPLYNSYIITYQKRRGWNKPNIRMYGGRR